MFHRLVENPVENRERGGGDRAGPHGISGRAAGGPGLLRPAGAAALAGSGETGQGGAGRRAPVEDRLLPGAVPPAGGEVPGQRTLPGEREEREA